MAVWNAEVRDSRGRIGIADALWPQYRVICELKGLRFSGFLAWWMGRSYHLLMMPGLARKVRVVADWTTAMLFSRDLSQLGALGRRTPLDDGTG